MKHNSENLEFFAESRPRYPLGLINFFILHRVYDVRVRDKLVPIGIEFGQT